jgi:hypothetical protein
MASTTLYNKNEAQVSVKADDDHSYWLPPRNRTTIPATVNRVTLPSGVRVIKDPTSQSSAS